MARAARAVKTTGWQSEQNEGVKNAMVKVATAIKKGRTGFVIA